MLELVYWYKMLLAANVQYADSLVVSKHLYQHISYLASDSLEGRAPNTRGDTLTIQYLSQYFENIGLKPLGKQDSYQWNFEYLDKKDTIRTSNLVATTGNRHSRKVLIAAHFDHLGYGNSYSLDAGKRAIHNGADDNASGVALMLELARTLQHKATNLPFDVILVGIGGHETGLHGSAAFAKTFFPATDTIIWAINLDMVGRMDSNTRLLFFRYSDTNEQRYQCLTHLSDSTIQIQPKLFWGKLDHTIFTALGIPSGTFSTGMHADYHRASDDAQKINYKGMYYSWKFLYNFVVTQLARGNCLCS